MTSRHYILEGREIKPVDLMTWARWLDVDPLRGRIKRDVIGDVTISTVFLGLDHRWGDGPPVLFETMVFGGSLDEAMERYSTYDEAETGHDLMVARVRASDGHA